MSAELRWEQCCETSGCKKPALHGVLCAACFYLASPARRAVELLASPPARPPDKDVVSAAGAAWLARIWAA